MSPWRFLLIFAFLQILFYKELTVKLLYFMIIFFSPFVFGQQRMDLDDLEIKGELLGDNRLQMLNREKNKLRNFVEFRTNYRKEMIEGLEKPLPLYLDHKATRLRKK